MALTVHEALDLKALERFKLVAGLNGLNNNISRVGLIDHEDWQKVTDTVITGEFLFSNFLLIKDHPEKILEYIKRFIDSDVACFALKTIYFDAFPDEVIDYANKHKFPLFTFDETYIEDIILDIDQALNIHSQTAKLQGYIDHMIQEETDPLKVRALALKLNKQFSNHFIAASITSTDQNLTTQLMMSTLTQVLGRKCTSITYEDTLLLICSFNPRTHSDDNHHYMQDYVLDALSACGFDLTKCIIGLSTPKHSLGTMGRAILESRYALEYSGLKQIHLSEFSTLGIYQVLIPNMNNPWFYSYYESMIQKILRYDEKNDTDLLYTAQTYVECDTNIQKTSEKLFQHVNTVRYRIKKIKEILEIDTLDGMKYESMALAIHLYNLHNR